MAKKSIPPSLDLKVRKRCHLPFGGSQFLPPPPSLVPFGKKAAGERKGWKTRRRRRRLFLCVHELMDRVYDI